VIEAAMVAFTMLLVVGAWYVVGMTRNG